MRATSHWNNLIREVAESATLDTFNIQLDRVLGHLVQMMLSFAQEKLDQVILKAPFQRGILFYVNSALNPYNRATSTSVCKTNTGCQHLLKDWSKTKQAQSYTLHCNRFLSMEMSEMLHDNKAVREVGKQSTESHQRARPAPGRISRQQNVEPRVTLAFGQSANFWTARVPNSGRVLMFKKVTLDTQLLPRFYSSGSSQTSQYF